MAIPMQAEKVLDRHFLEMRCKILEVAASFDRIDRAEGAPQITGDPRLKKLAEALGVLSDGQGNRAERVQLVFSDPYDPNWQRPERTR